MSARRCPRTRWPAKTSPPLKAGRQRTHAVRSRDRSTCATGRHRHRSASKTVTLANDGAGLPTTNCCLPPEPRRRASCRSPRRVDAAVYLRTFDDALEIRAHLKRGRGVAIIGGGFIGLELAAAARQLGCAASRVIEAQPRILMRGVPAEIAAVIHAAHERQGVAHRSAAARSRRSTTSASARRSSLRTARRVEADSRHRRSARMPEPSLAEAAGLAIDNGVAVDEHLAHQRSGRSSLPAIAARSRWRSTADGGCGSKLGATPRSRARSRREHARRRRRGMPRCPGSGPTNITSACRSPACRTRAPRPCAATWATAPSSSSICGGRPARRGQWHRPRRPASVRDIRLAEMLIDRRAYPAARQARLA